MGIKKQNWICVEIIDREEDLSGISTRRSQLQTHGASRLDLPPVACYRNTISDSYYIIISLATSNHCDFGSSFFEALRSAFCFSMAVSTCHIARSSSISS